ncbi:MAG: hypothetical protein KGJ61_09700 [Candidatus Omnitrophica bacterium]|nr:hypothetical protein [Candidatus Omnitrophota bacterium]
MDKNKIAGSELANLSQKQQIYRRYIQAFKKGAFNFIKEDYDTYSHESFPRKYFSGGMVGKYTQDEITRASAEDLAMAAGSGNNLEDLRVDVAATGNATQAAKKPNPIWVVPQGTKALPMEEVNPIFQKVQDIAKWPIAEGWRNYWYALYRNYFKVAKDKASGKWWLSTLKIDDKNNGNFKPSALLTDEQREKWLGIVPYSKIIAESPKDEPHETSYMLLDGGAGSAFSGLDSLVREIFPERKNPIGAKGTDVFFSPASSRSLSPAEIKMMFLIRTVAEIRLKEKEQGIEGLEQATFYYEPILGPDSFTTYDELYGKTPYDHNLYLKMLKDINPNATPDDVATYGALLKALNINVLPERNRELVTPNFPGLNMQTKEPVVAKTFGSHGSIGVFLCNQLVSGNYHKPVSGLPKIISFSNGDGVNNFLDETTAKWMAAKQIPVVMVTTAKTGVDKKGGQIGVEGTVVTDQNGNFVKTEYGPGKIKIRMLEQATAKENDQLNIFKEMGLSEENKGEQAFNTNVIGVNEGVLAEILQRIYKEILIPQAREELHLQPGEYEERVEKKAMEDFNTLIAPDLIAGDKKGVIQLEGPIGTVFINLQNWIEEHQKAKDIVIEVTGDPNARLLTLVGTTFEQRSTFFTPIKSTLDWLLQAFSDYYTLDMKTQVLKSAKDEGRTVDLPEIDVSDAYDAYKNVKKAIMAIPGITVDGQRMDITGKKVEMGNAPGSPYYEIRINGTVYPVDGEHVKIDKFFVQKLKILKLVAGNNGIPSKLILGIAPKNGVTEPEAREAANTILNQLIAQKVLTKQETSEDLLLTPDLKKEEKILSVEETVRQIVSTAYSNHPDKIDEVFGKIWDVLTKAANLSGLVLFPGAHLEGKVEIYNNTRHEVNLYDVENANLERTKDGRLLLKNVKITINNKDNKPDVSVQRLDHAQVAQKAMIHPFTNPGGIDFSLNNINLDIRSDGSAIKFNIDPALVRNGDFSGLVPVVLSISPVKDLPEFFGVRAENQEESQLAKV